ncbi:class I SAM-dependent methyltransferase [Spirosoma luteum]|uniref:class I SAM-dependent methyltransferase n=1 Tax=Spirosoma luteum TaxID=431553 RepID=UPI000380027E|nr:class I SAM-dependent methyltransferase [Spirosoma luteum]
MNNIEANQQQTWSEHSKFTLDRYRQFARHLPGNSLRVLDCGCNTGRGGNVLKQLFPGIDLYGIDLLPERIEQIPAGVYHRAVAGSAAELPFEADFFDGIVAGEFVEHLADPDLLSTFREFKRVLKPGGKILLTTPNPESYLVTKMGRTHIFDDPSHVNIMATGILKDKLATCGLTLVSIAGSGKASRYVGERFPLFNVYGSYLATVTY